MASRLANYVIWVQSGNCWIRNREGQLERLQLNRAQYAVLMAMFEQALAKQPVRVIVPKARKRGITTLTETLGVFLVIHYVGQVAATMAHLAASTDEIFTIASLAARRYVQMFDEGLGFEADVLTRCIRSAATESRYWCHTMGPESVAAGGSPTFLHLSEVALYDARTKLSSYPASLKAVADNPHTAIVEESTARGRDAFFAKYESAVRCENSYKAVFVPWFFGDDLTLTPPKDFERTEDDIEEAAIAASYDIELDDGQLYWRRKTQADIGDAMFKREFPSTPGDMLAQAKGRVISDLRPYVISGLPFAYDATEPFVARVGGIDFGYNDPTVILSGVYTGGILYVIGIYRAQKALSSEHAQELLPGHTYYCDPSGLQARQDMGSAIPQPKLSQARFGGSLQAQLTAAPTSKGTGQLSRSEEDWRRVDAFIRTGCLRLVAGVADQLILEADNLFYSNITGRVEQIRTEECGHFDTLCALRYMILGIVQATPVMRRSGDRPKRERAGLRDW